MKAYEVMVVRALSVLLLTSGCASHSGTRSADPAEAQRTIAEETLRAMFYTLDCTDEGHLEAGEIAEHMAQIFRPFDVDRSISLSPREFSAAGRLQTTDLQAQAFTMSDADGNGVVTTPEFTRYLEKLMVIVDADGNGEITPLELGDPGLGP